MANLYDVLQQSLAVGCFACFLLLIHACFGKLLSAQWKARLWGLLFVRALLPHGIFGRDLFFSADWLVSNLRVWVERTVCSDGWLGDGSAYASAYVGTMPRFPWGMLPTTAPQSITDWLFCAYLVWVMGAMLWFLVAYLRLCRRITQAVPVAGARLDAMYAIAERFRLPRPVRVVESNVTETPFVMGVIRPTLVLPMGWDCNAETPDHPQQLMLLHELLHIKYHDVAWGWGTTLLRCAYPFLWRICDTMDNAREVACDERVLLRIQGETRRTYGRALLGMAEVRFLHLAGATTMANGGRNIQKRVQAIATFCAVPRGMQVVSGCIMLMIGMYLVSVPTQATEPITDTRPPFATVHQALAYGQRNAPITVAGAFDFYAQSVVQAQEVPLTALAYRAAVCDANTIQSLTETIEQTNILAQVQQVADAEGDTAITLPNSGFLCDVFVRGLVPVGNKTYRGELWLYWANPDSWSEDARQYETLIAQCHTLQLQQQADGTWQVQSCSVTTEVCTVHDTRAAQAQTAVQWGGAVDGVMVAFRDITWYGLYPQWQNSQYLQMRLGGALPPPERDAQFIEYSPEYWVHKTAEDGSTVQTMPDVPDVPDTQNNVQNDMQNIVGFEVRASYQLPRQTEQVVALYRENCITGEHSDGVYGGVTEITAWSDASGQETELVPLYQGKSVCTVSAEGGVRTCICGGDIFWLQTTEVHYTAVLFYADGTTQEVALQCDVSA